MAEANILVSPGLFLFLSILWGISIVFAFGTGAVFWSKYGSNNNVALQQNNTPPQAVKPVTTERKYRSA